MKIYIKTIILFSIPIFIIFIYFEYKLRNIPNDYMYKANYLNKNAKKIELLVLGSSHSYYGINPVYFSLNSFNASYVSQSLDYDFCIFNKYIKNMTNLKYVVIPISYPTLFSKLDQGVESWRAINYSIYYKCDLFNFNFFMTENDLKSNIKRLKRGVLKSCSELGFGIHNKNREMDLIVTGKEAAKRHTKTNINSEENVCYLTKIIEVCKKRDIKIIIYTTPTHYHYRRFLNKKQLNKMEKICADFDNKYDNVKYFNFIADTSFIDSDFYDADHLNENGAKKLTFTLNQIIENN